MLIQPLSSALTVLLMTGLISAHGALHAQEQPQSQTAGQAQAVDQRTKSRKSKFPDDLEGLQEMANQARAEGNALRFLQANIKLRQKQPLNPDYIAGMAIAYAMMGKKNTAFDYMWNLQKLGLSHDFDNDEEMSILHGTEVYDYLNDLLKRQGEPMGEAELAFKLGKSAALPVALEWDSSRNRFLVGTAIDGLVLAVDEKGAVEELIRASEENGLWSVTGIKADTENNRLWVSTAALPLYAKFIPSEHGQSALVEFELDSLELVARYLAPLDGMPHEFGPLALMPSGDVYIADRLAPIVFRKLAGGKAIERFSTLANMSGFRDMTLGPGSHFLYLSDRENGIVVIDPVAQTAGKLGGPETLNLWGSEGLVSWRNSLIVVQSGTNPQRILKLELDANFSTVTDVKPLAVAQDGFDWPTFGAIKDNRVYYFANGQLLNPGSEAEAVLVMSSQLDPTEEIVTPDMQKFREEQAEREKQRAAAKASQDDG